MIFTLVHQYIFFFKGLTERDIFKLHIKETIRRPSSSLHRLKPPLGFQEGSRQNYPTSFLII